MEHYNITGMSCAACQARIEKAVSAVDGVESCAVSLLTNSMGVKGTAKSANIIKAVEKAGYEATLQDSTKKGNAQPKIDLNDGETTKLRRRLIASAAFLLALMYITMGHNMLSWPVPSPLEHNHLGLALAQLLLSASVMIINRKFFTSGAKALISRAPNMDTLVALGSTVSFSWSVFILFKMTFMITGGAENMGLMELYHNQLYFETAAMIPALITLGKLLESISKGKTTNALKNLIKLKPKKAIVLRNGKEIELDADQVQVGDIFVVKPGGSIPVDGIVIEGESAVDESTLTGESASVDKAPGEKVSAATINRSGYLKCRASRVGEDTTISQIIKMVADAAATKAPIARIADKISEIFVPAVIGLAMIVTTVWLILGSSVGDAISRGICVLVISCPCALGLATPVAIMVGNGLGAKNGILIKSGEALETVGRIDIVALDKTGTVTEGASVVTDVIPAKGIIEDELLAIAASIESKSEHPLSRAIIAEAEKRKLRLQTAQNFKAQPGNGIEATVDGEEYKAGSSKYIQSVAVVEKDLSDRGNELAENGKTPLYFAKDGHLLGIVGVADVIKRSSSSAIAQLKKLGLRVVILTGDNEKTARFIANQAGIDEVIANVLPGEKETTIRRLQKEGKVAMVGDGINDAPALTRADVGIAIGAGTDIAIDSASIVLTNSNLADVAACVRLGRGTLRNIRQNLFWAFFYNLICIPLAAGAFGLKMDPMIAAAAMSLSSVTVCLNALRLNLLKIKDASHDKAKQRKVEKSREVINDSGSLTVKIDGMMCAHCEATVQNAVQSLDFVEDAKADHTTGTLELRICGEPNENMLKEAVDNEDYIYIGKK